MDDTKLEALLGGLGQTLEKINGRLEKLEKAQALQFDPAKLKATTGDKNLPALRVVEPDPNAASGVPGGKLEEPWADPRFPRPDPVR